MMAHPYQSLDEKCFWSPAVAKKNMFAIDQLWDPKYKITRKMQVASYGSCFAQHIGRALSEAGFKWLISENAPSLLSYENRIKFNYGIFSSRVGNIYTVSLLKQWIEWSLQTKTVPEEIWESNGRFYDPFRPAIEPDGFASPKELLASRQIVLSAFYKSFAEADVFVFTLGLTESWWNKVYGYEYPMCPGTVAGQFEVDNHEFINQQYEFIKKNLIEAIRLMRSVNPKLKVLLTVSPVPLTATNSGNHVLLATVESKSILRAVAGSVAKQFIFVDYFPSFEMISAFPYRASFFEPNLRSVTSIGVGHVMHMFFSALTEKYPEIKISPLGMKSVPKKDAVDLVCEEAVLNAFAKGAK